MKIKTPPFVPNCTHETSVKRIGNGWNCRVYRDGAIVGEQRVMDRRDIGIVLKEMLRMEDKCGHVSPLSKGARYRLRPTEYHGKVFIIV